MRATGAWQRCRTEDPGRAWRNSSDAALRVGRTKPLTLRHLGPAGKVRSLGESALSGDALSTAVAKGSATRCRPPLQPEVTQPCPCVPPCSLSHTSSLVYYIHFGSAVVGKSLLPDLNAKASGFRGSGCQAADARPAASCAAQPSCRRRPRRLSSCQTEPMAACTSWSQAEQVRQRAAQATLSANKLLRPLCLPADRVCSTRCALLFSPSSCTASSLPRHRLFPSPPPDVSRCKPTRARLHRVARHHGAHGGRPRGDGGGQPVERQRGGHQGAQGDSGTACIEGAVWACQRSVCLCA